jgi:Protein of unknown function (DUF1569)
MKTIFDNPTRDELIDRIKTVTENSVAEWGKMTVYQMLRHCTIWDEWILGLNKPIYKQEFLGRIFGKMALRKMIKNESPLDKNIPTSKQFKPLEQTGDIEAEKAKWISLLHHYANYNNPNFIHDFFGKMTEEQIGCLVYKHTDHHLRQFGA